MSGRAHITTLLACQAVKSRKKSPFLVYFYDLISKSIVQLLLPKPNCWIESLHHTQFHMNSLKDKVALVTGGTGAIGSATATALASLGLRLIIVDLDQAKCTEFATSLPTSSVGISINVADEESVIAGVDSALAELGASGVDVLINIAGILSNNKVFETTAEEWRKVNAINYDGCFYLAKKCLKHMQKQKWGRVVNMSSWAWKSGGLTAGTAYSCSKAAVVGLTFSLARQFAGDGVTVNAVAPCYVFSKMIMEQLTEEQVSS
jgi:3-oxoacyl-[acyl-carrier protein] reductase